MYLQFFLLNNVFIQKTLVFITKTMYNIYRKMVVKMVHSTRSLNKDRVSNAIIKGLAFDGGLFVFDEFKKINLNELLDLDYKEIAFKVMSLYLDDFSPLDLKEMINKAYNEENFSKGICQVTSFSNYSFLELYHGPTASFKDMALTILPYEIEYAKKINNINEETKIVVATSGDTGSATLSGFRNSNASITVLYPNLGVSKLQEKQMLYYEGRNKAIAINGNFDDSQRIVKEILLKNKNFSAANSINIGRLIPQIVYYFYAYIKLIKNNVVKLNEMINVSVPTGNFGNILAGFIAKNMGLPIKKLICAANENNVLTDFINTGIYDANRPFYKTHAPSMDILVSSNLERLIYYFSNDVELVKKLYVDLEKNKRFELPLEFKEKLKDFKSFYSTDQEILRTIKDEFETHNYLIDPHTAVALDAYKKSKESLHTLIVSTASPYKFIDVIKQALNLKNEDEELVKEIFLTTKMEIPSSISVLLNKEYRKKVMEKEEVIKEI